MSELSVNNEINISFYERKWVVALSVISSISSLPISFMLAGKVTLAAIIVLMIGLSIIAANFYDLIRTVLYVLKEINKSMTGISKSYECNHNCKEVIKEELECTKSEFRDSIELITKDVDSINKKVEKTPESFDLIDMTDNTFMIITNEYASKSYIIKLEGKHVNEVELDSLLFACKSTSHQVSINLDSKSCTDIKKVYDIDTKIGVNHSFFRIKCIGDSKPNRITLTIAKNGFNVVDPKSISLN